MTLGLVHHALNGLVSKVKEKHSLLENIVSVLENVHGKGLEDPVVLENRVLLYHFLTLFLILSLMLGLEACHFILKHVGSVHKSLDNSVLIKGEYVFDGRRSYENIINNTLIFRVSLVRKVCIERRGNNRVWHYISSISAPRDNCRRLR